jgi:uncharacterized protein
MKIGVISDTHGYLNPRVFHLFEGVSRILHAGDVGADYILDDLAAIAPVNAVSGNVDGIPTARRPQKFSAEFGGLRICMTHGHLLDASDYDGSALAMFSSENPRIIIHGHPHVAREEVRDGVTFLNPGAACKPRFRDVASVAIIHIKSPDNFLCEILRL